ncbi:GTP cyclohydrolase II [Arthrobacter sp. Alg241-R88]|uniref:GTP cyclohydrolase II n=1 Tax=Arthrobacter sp. Alg241-R88 TaxID=2305984 RepID=UPI0013D13859|nr:GTP cyclohydrolase II [Arthrobacter sp. Alg241-R88]
MTASGASGNGHHLPDSGNGHYRTTFANGHHQAESGNGRVPHPVSGGPIVQLPTAFGDFIAQAWIDLETGAEHLAVSSPNPPKDGQAPLVRLHSECLTGDVFGSYRCDCGEQLAYALEMIREHGGTLLYLRGQEGRGIGLANKIKAYALQEAGFDTVEANEQLGLPVDARCYKAAAQVLAEMGLHEVRLLSNNPDKQNRLAKAGVKVVEMVPTEVPSRDQNIRYLQTKKDRMEHRLVLGTHVGVAVPVTTPDTSFDHEQD